MRIYLGPFAHVTRWVCELDVASLIASSIAKRYFMVYMMFPKLKRSTT